MIKLRLTKSVNDKRDPNVHYGVLRKSWEFFSAAMRPEWAREEEPPDTLTLPVNFLDIVSDYTIWLYSDKVPVQLYQQRKEDTREKAHEEAEKVFVQLARAYVFAEKVIDIKYKNGLGKVFIAAAANSG